MANWQGREEEIANLKQWLNNPNIPLIGIEGIGGIGKSMLAAYLYEDEEIAGFTKRFWADVSYGAVFSDVATQVLQEFGFRVPEQEAQLVQALVKCLQSGEYLLIIDNLESLLQSNGLWGSQFHEEFFTTWVECGGKSKVIVTTRERPELPKRWEWLPLSGLKSEDGIKLLTALGIQGNLEEFVKLVDGYPLLLQFVADLLKAEYPQDPHLKRLASLGLGNLQQLLTDAKGHHRCRENVGMVLVLDASFERLNELQKSLLQNISVYRGAVNSQAAASVCLGSSETEIEKELRNLVKRSFLSENLIDDCRWFEFQPVVLEYVRYKAGNQTEAHQKAIDYYCSIAKQSPWQTKDDIKEYLEIFYHFYQLADYDSAFGTIWRCNKFLDFRGCYTIQIKLYGQLVSKWKEIGSIKKWEYEASLTSLGNAYFYQGQYQRAINFHQRSLEIAMKIGDQYGESLCLTNLGNAYFSLTKYQRAIEFHQESLEISREIGARNGEGISLGNLGLAYLYQEQYSEAIEFLQKSLNMAREKSNSLEERLLQRYIEGLCLMNLGLAYCFLKQYAKGINFYQQSLNIAREIADRNTEGKSLANLGLAYLYQKQYSEGIELLQQSLKIAREIGDRYTEVKSWFNLGEALENINRESDALVAYRNARELFQAIRADVNVQLCNNAIERLSQPKTPVVSRRGFWGWLRRLWR